MAWSGGTYTKGNNSTGGWTGDAAAGIGIEAGRHDTQDNDFATGINQCLNKDGSNAATGNLNIGNFKLTAVANGTARTDAANLGQLQDSGPLWGATSSGSANAQTLTLSPAITAYAAGQRFSFLAGYTNTAATTLNVNSVGAKNIFNAATGAAIGAGEIIVGRMYEVIYDGTQFLLINDTTPIQNGDYIWLGTTGGTATAQTASATPAITGYKAGQKFRMKIGAGLGSTGAAVTAHTLNINSIGAKNFKEMDGANPTIGTWVAGALLECLYDGTNFVITNDPGGWLAYTITTSNLTGVSPNVITSITSHNVRYRKIGKIVHLHFDSQINLGTGGGAGMDLVPPINASASVTATNMFYIGTSAIDGTATTIPFLYFTSATNLRLIKNVITSSAFTAGTGTYLRYQIAYESV